MTDADDRIASGYDAFYAAWGQSPALRRIWREHVTGPDFPEEYAHISFLPLAALDTLTDALALGEGDLLVDLACGAGGPGLWAASQTGARLLGIDLSSVAVQRAAERAEELGLGDRASFRQGSFATTGVEAGAADAVMTVDALQYAPDKRAALAEIHRILEPGGRFAFVVFELDPANVAGMGVWDDPIDDYRPLLADAGFDVLAYDQLPDWRRAVHDGFTAVVDEQDTLTSELGEAAGAALTLEAAITLQLDPYCGHVLGVATTRA